MINTVKTFKEEVEIERMRLAMEQGTFIFLVSLGFSIIFVLVLWDYVDLSLLLLWFSALNVINVVKWIFFLKSRRPLNSLNRANILGAKLILFIGSLVSGLSWGVASLIFIDLAQPYTLMIILVSIFFVSMISILSLFSYLPAVMAFIIPAEGCLIVPLLLTEDNGHFNLGLVLTITLIVIIVGCIKAGRNIISTLHLNFENVALHHDSEEKSLMLRTALENIDQGISMSDKHDRLRMWNQQFTNLLGTQGYKVVADINLESILNAIEPPLMVNSKNRTEHHLKDGRVFEIRQNQLQQGGRVLTFTDISDLFQREQALEQARKTAEQVNSAKTRFLAAASHDLRQPIHALGLFFAELSERVQSPETELLINQVNDSISAINSMLTALLDVSKLDAGVIKPNVESFKLITLFIRLKLDFKPIAFENNNEIRIRQTNVAVKSDFAMLERLLRNLIGNALKYTNDGRILVAARKRGENILIQVIDNGPGIPENQLEEVFAEFYQLENPARDRRKGLGLGLAIVKRLANLLNHKITLASNFGHGCCFTISLPIAHIKGDKPRAKRTNHALPYTIGGRQILVLDDDDSVLQGMNGLLRSWGYQVTTASSLAEAFNKLEGNQIKPELLIVDYRLSDNISGIDAAKQIQSNLAYPTSVLLITGDTGPELLQEADISQYPMLHKPVQPARLRTTIQYLFSKLIKYST